MRALPYHVIDDLIDGNLNYVANKITSTSSQNICARVAARLRQLADKLDEACNAPTENEP